MITAAREGGQTRRSTNKPRAPREAASWALVGGRSQCMDEEDDAVIGGEQSAFASKLLNLRKGKALVRRKTRQRVG